MGGRNGILGLQTGISFYNSPGNIITDDLKKMWQAEIDKFGNMIQEEVIID